MASKSPLKLDLNNLFHPAIEDGPVSLSLFKENFATVHSGINALRNTGQLGFSWLPDDIRMQSEVLTLAERFQGVKNIVVFGIGGSALGAKSIFHALQGPFAPLQMDEKRFFVLDNIDPDTFVDLAALIQNDDNLFIVISKSGNTSETLAQFLFAKKVFHKFGPDNVVLITDPEEGLLRDLVAKENYPSLPIPPGVGGRFSVFSAAGLFPLAVAGVSIEMLLDGARYGEKVCRHEVLAQNPAALLAVTLDFWARERGLTELVFMPYSDRLMYFSDWAAQLFAESLNKCATLTRQTPRYGLTILKALGTTDQHSQLQLYLDGPRNKIICFVESEHKNKAALAESTMGDDRLDFLSGRSLAELLQAEKLATEESLRENGRPTATIHIEETSAFQIGQLYQIVMNVIPYLGGLLEINPYDQPAVERIKKFTFGLMGKKGFEDFAEKLEDRPKRDGFVF